MYAVIKTGGKQYKVSAGDLLKVEKLAGAVGETIELDEVLMVGGEEVKIGTPLLPNAKVTATIVEQGKDKKILSSNRSVVKTIARSTATVSPSPVSR
jgi:large subunit ribosomal protein L21